MQLDAIGIIVSSLPEAIRFYQEFGLEFGEQEGPHVEAVTRGGLRVMLDTEDLVREIDPTWRRPEASSIGLAFLCGSPSEVDAAYDRIVALGYRGKSAPWDAFWGQRYASVLDPDGHQVDLFAPLA